MSSIDQRISFPVRMAAALISCCAPPIAAGAGFVAGADITEEPDGATVTISFNCRANYLSHQPSASGNLLRITIEPVGCEGAPFHLPESTENIRPVEADKVRLVDIEYQSQSYTEATLTLAFDEDVNFAVLPSQNSTTLSVKVFVGARSVEQTDTETEIPGRSTVALGNAADIIRRRGAADDDPVVASGPMTQEKLASLMTDGRRALIEGNVSRAIQIYTKVLQYPGHEHLPQAQEYLALARERNGQLAHAKAEYQKYLALYPEGEGTSRVRQRLNALLAVDNTGDVARSAASSQRTSRSSDWTVHTFLSQFYRRDANKINDRSEVVSQSSIYSDLNLDARRRGERFDFSARLSAGYRNDFISGDEGPGNETRISYAYSDLADAGTGIRGRLGRQSRNTGGVLGRFDGLNLDYKATERTTISTVAGKPVNSSSDGIDEERSFYGISANYGPVIENLEVGVFYIQQDVADLTDRQAVGAEFRYFGSDRFFWGLIDYDTLYRKVGSYFLQGVWRIDSKFSINGSVDRRMGPFLSTSNALIGQSSTTIEDLLATFTEDEIRKLALDRTSVSSTYNLGFSRALTPKLQFNASFSDASIDDTPESGGVPATESTEFKYYSANLVASSLLKEGDVSIFDVRYSESSTTKVESIALDTRFPIGNELRINPSIRVHRRTILSDSSVEWIYAPRLRVQYRWGRRIRIYLEAGKQFSERETGNLDFRREYFFANVGYQAIF